jgi:hypothetical protein
MTVNTTKSLPKHGTLYSYTKLGCRCRPCTEAKAQWQRDYRAKGDEAIATGYEIDVPKWANEAWAEAEAKAATARANSQAATSPANPDNQPDTTSDLNRIADMDLAEWAQYRTRFAFARAGGSDII